MADHGIHRDLDDQVDGQTQPEVEPGEIVIGTFVAIDSEGKALVDYKKNPLKQPIVAISTIPIIPAQIKRRVALLFAENSYSKPIVIGFIHNPLDALLEAVDSGNGGQLIETEQSGSEASVVDSSDASIAQVDGERIVIEGKKEIVLRCGDASITLTRAGKVIIRGNYLLNRSSGINRIMGGSVQVN